jgi:hypothetical protein
MQCHHHLIRIWIFTLIDFVRNFRFKFFPDLSQSFSSVIFAIPIPVTFALKIRTRIIDFFPQWTQSWFPSESHAVDSEALLCRQPGTSQSAFVTDFS